MVATGGIVNWIGLICGGFFALIFLVMGIIFLVMNVRARKLDPGKSKTGMILGIIFLVIGACGFLGDLIFLIISFTRSGMF